MTFFNIMIQIVAIAHFMSCLFFYVGMEEVRAGNYSWLNEENLLGKSFRTRYTVAMYWAFTTMSAVGYGEITPQS